jgi:hypothetical protein
MSNKKLKEIEERNDALEETAKANLAVYEKEGWTLVSKTSHGYMHMWPGLLDRIGGVKGSVWLERKKAIEAKFPEIQTAMGFPLGVRVPDVCVTYHFSTYEGSMISGWIVPSWALSVNLILKEMIDGQDTYVRLVDAVKLALAGNTEEIDSFLALYELSKQDDTDYQYDETDFDLF